MITRAVVAALVSTLLLAGLLTASDAYGRKLDVLVTGSATQSTQSTSKECGTTSEQIAIRTGTVGRYFLYPGVQAGVELRFQRAGSHIVSSGTVVRRGTQACHSDPGDPPPKCGMRTLRFQVDPGLIQTFSGHVLGMALAALPVSATDPFPSCPGGIGGLPGLLTPPLFSLTATPSERYVYGHLPRGFTTGCTRRRAVVSGRAKEVKASFDYRQETTMRFTIVMTRVGCLG